MTKLSRSSFLSTSLLRDQNNWEQPKLTWRDLTLTWEASWRKMITSQWPKCTMKEEFQLKEKCPDQTSIPPNKLRKPLRTWGSPISWLGMRPLSWNRMLQQLSEWTLSTTKELSKRLPSKIKCKGATSKLEMKSWRQFSNQHTRPL